MEKQTKFNFENAKERKAVTYWNFRENAVCEGVLKEVVISPENEKEMFIVELDNNDIVTIGSYTTLQGKLTKDDIGRAVHIEFTDEVKSKTKGNKPYMNFKVLVV